MLNCLIVERLNKQGLSFDKVRGILLKIPRKMRFKAFSRKISKVGCNKMHLGDFFYQKLHFYPTKNKAKKIMSFGPVSHAELIYLHDDLKI